MMLNLICQDSKESNLNPLDPLGLHVQEPILVRTIFIKIYKKLRESVSVI